MSHYLGYGTCYYRTFAVTQATQRQKDVYKRAYDWLQASIEVVRPGITTADIAAQWPSAREMGYTDEREAFALAVGHGIGLSHHEKGCTSRLRPSMVKKMTAPESSRRSSSPRTVTRSLPNGRARSCLYATQYRFASRALDSRDRLRNLYMG